MRSCARRPAPHDDEARFHTVRAQRRAAGPLVAAGLAALTAGLMALGVAGCSTRHDVDYNRYAPPGGRPTLLHRADQLADLPARPLDNLDERIENAVY